jgi:hypothetical protein
MTQKVTSIVTAPSNNINALMAECHITFSNLFFSPDSTSPAQQFFSQKEPYREPLKKELVFISLAYTRLMVWGR